MTTRTPEFLAVALLSLFFVASAQGAEPAKRRGVKTGHAPVNGLKMYYEIHGAGRPLVLLHGAYSSIGVDFGKLLPILAKTHQVIAIEQQGHGHTADIDRPITYEQMADDTAALLKHLGIQQADFFGYSMGGGVALQVAKRHPALVRKWVAAGGTAYSVEGLYPELLEFFPKITPEMFQGSPFHEGYLKTSPDPKQWPGIVEKLKALDVNWKGWSADDIRSIRAPVLIVIGDSDIVKPEHAVELFRLVGGGVVGDVHGLPRSQLAVLPGTHHVGVSHRTEWLASMTEAFLNAPEPKTQAQPQPAASTQK